MPQEVHMSQLIRVVALRKGKLLPSEFRLRRGERGLSLFACLRSPAPFAIVEAVRAKGKKGELAPAALKVEALNSTGLTIVRTPGETGNPEIDAIHFEARLPFRRRLLLRFKGPPEHEFFNEHFSQKLCSIAQLIEGEE